FASLHILCLSQLNKHIQSDLVEARVIRLEGERRSDKKNNRLAGLSNWREWPDGERNRDLQTSKNRARYKLHFIGSGGVIDSRESLIAPTLNKVQKLE